MKTPSHDPPSADFVESALNMDPPPEEPLRSDLLTRTTRVLRRRRRRKQLLVAAALMGCYLAGVATTPLWSSLPFRLAESERRPTGRATDESAASPHDATPPPRAGVQRDRPRAVPRKVRRASFEEICRVSDRRLYQEDDLQSALGYYTRALKLATPEQRAISIDRDSWLLLALKQAHVGEERHVQNKN